MHVHGRRFVSSLVLIRYPAALVTALAVMFYMLLSLRGYVPARVVISDSVGFSVTAVFVFFYFVVWVGLGIVWQVWILGKMNSPTTRWLWRSVSRQGDREGVVWFDVVLLVLIMVGLYFYYITFSNYQDVATFLAFVAMLPVLIDFLPTVRPTRTVVRELTGVGDSPRGESLREVAHRVTPPHVSVQDTIRALVWYNRLDVHVRECATNPEMPLPQGMVIEVPPEFP